MAHFAHVNKGIVDSVIVIEPEVLSENHGWTCPECNMFVDFSEWVQTSYNTQAGIHTQGGVPLRKNFAGKGHSYDPVRDAFIPPKPFESWTLNEQTGRWQPPKSLPKVDLDKNTVEWNEGVLDWVVTPVVEISVSQKTL